MIHNLLIILIQINLINCFDDHINNYKTHHDDRISNYRHGFQDTFDMFGHNDHMDNYKTGPINTNTGGNYNHQWDHSTVHNSNQRSLDHDYKSQLNKQHIGVGDFGYIGVNSGPNFSGATSTENKTMNKDTIIMNKTTMAPIASSLYNNNDGEKLIQSVKEDVEVGQFDKSISNPIDIKLGHKLPKEHKQFETNQRPQLQYGYIGLPKVDSSNSDTTLEANMKDHSEIYAASDNEKIRIHRQIIFPRPDGLGIGGSGRSKPIVIKPIVHKKYLSDKDEVYLKKLLADIMKADKEKELKRKASAVEIKDDEIVEEEPEDEDENLKKKPKHKTLLTTEEELYLKLLLEKTGKQKTSSNKHSLDSLLNTKSLADSKNSGITISASNIKSNRPLENRDNINSYIRGPPKMDNKNPLQPFQINQPINNLNNNNNMASNGAFNGKYNNNNQGFNSNQQDNHAKFGMNSKNSQKLNPVSNIYNLPNVNNKKYGKHNMGHQASNLNTNYGINSNTGMNKNLGLNSNSKNMGMNKESGQGSNSGLTSNQGMRKESDQELASDLATNLNNQHSNQRSNSNYGLNFNKESNPNNKNADINQNHGMNSNQEVNSKLGSESNRKLTSNLESNLDDKFLNDNNDRINEFRSKFDNLGSHQNGRINSNNNPSSYNHITNLNQSNLNKLSDLKSSNKYIASNSNPVSNNQASSGGSNSNFGSINHASNTGSSFNLGSKYRLSNHNNQASNINQASNLNNPYLSTNNHKFKSNNRPSNSDSHLGSNTGSYQSNHASNMNSNPTKNYNQASNSNNPNTNYNHGTNNQDNFESSSTLGFNNHLSNNQASNLEMNSNLGSNSNTGSRNNHQASNSDKPFSNINDNISNLDKKQASNINTQFKNLNRNQEIRNIKNQYDHGSNFGHNLNGQNNNNQDNSNKPYQNPIDPDFKGQNIENESRNRGKDIRDELEDMEDYRQNLNRKSPMNQTPNYNKPHILKQLIKHPSIDPYGSSIMEEENKNTGKVTKDDTELFNENDNSNHFISPARNIGVSKLNPITKYNPLGSSDTEEEDKNFRKEIDEDSESFDESEGNSRYKNPDDGYQNGKNNFNPNLSQYGALSNQSSLLDSKLTGFTAIPKYQHSDLYSDNIGHNNGYGVNNDNDNFDSIKKSSIGPESGISEEENREMGMKTNDDSNSKSNWDQMFHFPTSIEGRKMANNKKDMKSNNGLGRFFGDPKHNHKIVDSLKDQFKDGDDLQQNNGNIYGNVGSIDRENYNNKASGLDHYTVPVGVNDYNGRMKMDLRKTIDEPKISPNYPFYKVLNKRGGPLYGGFDGWLYLVKRKQLRLPFLDVLNIEDEGLINAIDYPAIPGLPLDAYKLAVLKICKRYLDGMKNFNKGNLNVTEYNIKSLVKRNRDRIFICQTGNNDKNYIVRLYNMRILYGVRSNTELAAIHNQFSCKYSNLVPEIYGTFYGGIIMDNLAGVQLNMRQLVHRYNDTFQDLGRVLADVHSANINALPKSEMPFYKSIWMMAEATRLRLIRKPDRIKRSILGMVSRLVRLIDFGSGISRARQLSKTMNARVVFSLNSFSPHSILRRTGLNQNDNDTIQLMSFQFSAYNFRGFDLASVLIESGIGVLDGVNGTTPNNNTTSTNNGEEEEGKEDGEKGNMIEFTMKKRTGLEYNQQINDFIGAYVERWNEKGPGFPHIAIPTIREELERLKASVHLFWGVWSLYSATRDVDADDEKDDRDVLAKYGLFRLEEYLKEEKHLRLRFGPPPKWNLNDWI